MPFTLYVQRTVNGEPETIRWPNQPERLRAVANDAISRFTSAALHMEGSLHVHGRPVARWCDIKDIWIEEVLA